MHCLPLGKFFSGRRWWQTVLVMVTITLSPLCLAKDFVVTYRMDKMDGDHADQYDYQLLKLALEKTVDKYGPYVLEPVPQYMNLLRTAEYVELNKYPNLVYKQSASLEMTERLGYALFPADLGIVGYRVGFVSMETKSRLRNVSTIEELKSFSIIQGLGWLDTEILRHHGFNVVTGPRFDSLFFMVANNRGDIFMRGANELLDEWKKHRETQHLSYDETIALYYPLPRFFFTNKENTLLIKRLEDGLIQSYNDKSLIALWERFYKDSIDFVQLEKRKVFRLSNPWLEGIDTGYEKYIYDPSLR